MSIDRRILKLLGEVVETRNGWTRLAINDIRIRFRGTYLGVIWLVLHQSIMFTLVAWIWSKLFKVDFLEFAAYLGLGFAIWGFISSGILEGTYAIQQSSNLHLNTKTPLVVSIARTTFRSFAYFAMSILVPSIIAIATRGLSLQMLWVLPSLVLVVIFVFSLACILALIQVRFRDVGQIVSMVLQLAWLVTPIIYKKEFLPSDIQGLFVDGNPFAWMLMSIRESILSTENYPAKYLVFMLSANVFLLIIIKFCWKNNGRWILRYV